MPINHSISSSPIIAKATEGMIKIMNTNLIDPFSKSSIYLNILWILCKSTKPAIKTQYPSIPIPCPVVDPLRP